MEAWREEGLHTLLCIDSEQDLLNKLAGVANTLGFEYCGYVIQVPIAISRPRVALFNNYPDRWNVCYRTHGYLQIDPTVRHALRSTLPVVWSDALFASAQELWEQARAHGLAVGWAQSVRDASGSVGILTLARSAEQLTDKELGEKQTKMIWLVQIAHAGMARLQVPKLASERQIKMTAREKEVLIWTAEGKTAYEISQILSLSERTVNFHVNNVVLKLGASNKTQAAVMAVALGMLL